MSCALAAGSPLSERDGNYGTAKSMAAAALLCGAAYNAFAVWQRRTAYNAVFAYERRREKWELENFPEGEQREMVELYVKRGMTQADAESVIEVMSKYKNFFLDVMMVEELGLMPPDNDDSPMKNGLVTFAAFVLFGFVPLLSYVLAGATGASDAANFVAACALTGLTMLALGAAKAKFTNQSMLKSALLMLLNGSMAAVAAYLVSWGISDALGGVQEAAAR